MPEKEEFIVRDKRFSTQDDPQADEPETPPGEKEKPESSNAEDGDRFTQLPKVNFATFIFSLNSSALVHLGMLEDPATQKKVLNLPLAKQTIDILGMLEEKTVGNLSEDEEKMLRNILYDLRILYVKQLG